VKRIPVRKRTPYPKIPVRPTKKRILKFDLRNIRLGSDSVANRRIRKRILPIRNLKKPIVMDGAIPTMIFPEGQLPPQNAIATTSMA
jgi:hypothetical protein